MPMNDNTEDSMLLYLYCVVSCKPDIEETSDSIDTPFYIKYNDIYAVVSYASGCDFSKEHLDNNLSDMAWLEKRARIHDKTINDVLRGADITGLIPFKFATVFFNEDSLIQFLNDFSVVLKSNLDFLHNKEEWGIKIYCNKELLKESILNDDPSLKEFDLEIKSSSPGKAYLLKKKKKELADNLFLKRNNENVKECYKELKGLSVQSKINKLQPEECTGKKDEMVLNAVFLVNDDNIPKFTDSVLDLRNRYYTRGFDIECTGPWPAYNFCNIEKKD
jgi:hypothetical protein